MGAESSPIGPSHDVDDILGMFPEIAIYRELVEQDLGKTKSKEATVNNILDGRLKPSCTPVLLPPAPSGSSPPALFAEVPRIVRPALGAQLTAPRQPAIRPAIRPDPQALIQENEELEFWMEQLLSSNVDCEHAVCKRCLEALTAQIEATKAKQHLLELNTQKELRGMLKYRRITPKSLVAKVKGTLGQKQAREEAGYIKARSKEEATKRELEELQTLKETAQSKANVLAAKLSFLLRALRRQAQIRSAVYGASGSPQEAALEAQAQKILVEVNKVAVQKFASEMGRDFLVQASTRLQDALRELRDARAISLIKLISAGRMEDITKIFPLARARDLIQSARILTDNARELASNLPHVTLEMVQALNHLADSLFDGVTVSQETERRIEEAEAKVEETQRDLCAALSWSQSFAQEVVNPSFTRISASLQTTRAQLHEERRRILLERAPASPL